MNREIRMKKLAGLVVLIAALTLGSYYGMGVITERALRKNVALINPSNGLVIDVAEYHRGWFRSKALLNGHLHVPARTVTDVAGVTVTNNGPGEDIQVQIPLDIYHGPMMFVDAKAIFGLGYAHSDMTLPQVYAEQFTHTYTAESTLPKLNFSMFISYLNKTSLQVNVPAFKLVARVGDLQFQWLGMTSDLAVSSNRHHIDGSITVDGLNLLKEKVQVVLGPVTTHYDLHKTSLGLYLGDAMLNLSALSISQDGHNPIALQKFDVTSSSDIKDNLFSSHFKASLEKFSADGKAYGPAVLAIAITNLDAAVLARLNEQTNGTQQGSDAQRRQLLALLPELPALVSKGAGFEVSEFSVVMPDGRINGTLQVSLPVSKVDNPFQLIQKIQGQGKLGFSDAVLKQLMVDSAKKVLQAEVAAQPIVIESAVPASSPISTTENAAAPSPATVPPVVVQAAAVPATDINQQAETQANEKIAAMVQSGLLSLQGSDYFLELKLAAGQLSVNGKPFSSAMMKF